jgi:hypothetical protein
LQRFLSYIKVSTNTYRLTKEKHSMYNRIGVHEAPGLLKEGGGVMNKIQSESLSQKLPAVIKQQYSAFLNNGSVMVASCSGSRGREVFR